MHGYQPLPCGSKQKMDSEKLQIREPGLIIWTDASFGEIVSPYTLRAGRVYSTRLVFDRNTLFNGQPIQSTNILRPGQEIVFSTTDLPIEAKDLNFTGFFRSVRIVRVESIENVDYENIKDEKDSAACVGPAFDVQRPKFLVAINPTSDRHYGLFSRGVFNDQFKRACSKKIHFYHQDQHGLSDFNLHNCAVTGRVVDVPSWMREIKGYERIPEKLLVGVAPYKGHTMSGFGKLVENALGKRLVIEVQNELLNTIRQSFTLLPKSRIREYSKLRVGHDIRFDACFSLESAGSVIQLIDIQEFEEKDWEAHWYNLPPALEFSPRSCNEMKIYEHIEKSKIRLTNFLHKFLNLDIPAIALMEEEKGGKDEESFKFEISDPSKHVFDLIGLQLTPPKKKVPPTYKLAFDEWPEMPSEDVRPDHPPLGRCRGDGFEVMDRFLRKKPHRPISLLMPKKPVEKRPMDEIVASHRTTRTLTEERIQKIRSESAHPGGWWYRRPTTTYIVDSSSNVDLLLANSLHF